MTGTTAAWGFVLLAGAAVLLTIGAELFAENAAAASRRLGVSALAIGLILAGAEPEELLTAIFAAAQHHPGIAAGDAIGANVTMLTLVLGLAVVFRPIRSGGLLRSYALVAAAAGVAAVVALLGGGVGRLAGGLLVTCYAVIVGVIWRRERRPPMFGELAELSDDDDDDDDDERDEQSGAGTPAPSAKTGRQRRPVLLLLAGLVLMIVGGRLAVAGAERIVGSLGMSESVVGLTFVALATTAELFALVWAAARRGVEELAIAGLLGSVIYNATATLGVAALVRPLAVSGMVGPAVLAAVVPVALAVWASAAGRLGRVAGVLLLGCYAAYLTVTFA